MYEIYFNNSAFADDVTFAGSYNDSYEAATALNNILNSSTTNIFGIIIKEGKPIRTFYRIHNTDI